MALKMKAVCATMLLVMVRGSPTTESPTSQQDNQGGTADVEWARNQTDALSRDAVATEVCKTEGGAHQTANRARNSTSDVRQEPMPKKEDWCELRNRTRAQEEQIPRFPTHRALAGRQLRAGVAQFPPFLVVNATAPYGLGPGMRFDGPLVVEFDKFAVKYNVLVTYAVLPPIDRNATTIARYLEAQVAHYDVIIGAFVETYERRALELDFTSPVLDLSYSLYMRRSKTSRQSFMLFCLRPFDDAGSRAFILLAVLPAIAWRFMAREEARNEEQTWFRGPLIALGVRGPLAKLQALRWPLKLALMLWGVSAFFAIGCYSTSLTRVVLNEGQEQPPVRNFQEFRALRLTLCVSTNVHNEELVRPHFKGKIVAKPRRDLPKAVVDGECDGMLERRAVADVLMKGGQPQTLPSSPKAKPFGCDFVEVGTAVMEREGAFVTTLKDCKGFVRDIISMWLNRDREGKRALAGEIEVAIVNSGTDFSTSQPICGPGPGSKQISLPHFSEVLFLGALVMIGCAILVRCCAS